MYLPAFLSPSLPPACARPHRRTSFKCSLSTSETSLKTLRFLREASVLLCVRHSDAAIAESCARAALEGGIRALEISLLTPFASRLISRLSYDYPQVLIGAGTVLTPSDAEEAASAGAAFAMSPVTDPSVITACHENGMLAMPGAITPTECAAAVMRHGAHVVKVFPVHLAGGVEFVRALAGPLPGVPLLPMGGVKKYMIKDYLACGNVVAVGVAREILRKADVADGHWDAIRERAGDWMETVKEIGGHEHIPIR